MWSSLLANYRWKICATYPGRAAQTTCSLPLFREWGRSRCLLQFGCSSRTLVDATHSRCLPCWSAFGTEDRLGLQGAGDAAVAQPCVAVEHDAPHNTSGREP